MAYRETIAEAIVEVKTNTKQYEAGIGRVKGSLGKLGGMGMLAGGAVAAGIAIAAKKVLDFGIASAKVANDFEETQNRFKVIFGSVGDEAEKAAQTISTNFDLAQVTVKEMLSSSGDLLTGLGFTGKKALELSEQVAKLGGDLASWSNITGGAAAANEKLVAAMLGSTEATKALGFQVSREDAQYKELVKTLMKNEGMTKAQAQAQAFLTMAYERSTNALGDYARTADSLANRQRALKEEWKDFMVQVGTGINEVTKATGVMGLMAQQMRELRQFTSDIGSMGVVFKRAFAIIGASIRASILIFDIFRRLTTAVLKDVIAFVRDRFGPAMSGIADLIKQAFARVIEFIRPFFETLDSLISKIPDWASNVRDELKEIGKDFKDIWNDLGKAWSDASKDATANIVGDEKKKQAAIKKTLQTGTAEDIRGMMQRAVVGATATGSASPSSVVGGMTKPTSPANDVSSNVKSVADLIMETNNILRDIRTQTMEQPVIV